VPAGIGFELIAVLALLGILIVGAVVALLRGAESSQAASDNVSDHSIPAGNSDPDGGGADAGASVFERDASLSLHGRPAVVLLVGSRGSGRTTTAGKLAHRLVNRGRLVAVAAAGPLSLAATRELASWAEQSGADLITREGETDPAVSAYDAVETARVRRVDVLIIDLGPMPASEGSLDDLVRTSRVLERAAGRVDEVLLVLDATDPTLIANGRTFAEAVGATGVALSKLDAAVDADAVFAELPRLGIPVKFVGTGEDIRDLQSFDPGWFAPTRGDGDAGVPIRDSSPGVSEPPSAAVES
jgi:signal recognition particle GTPase